ncbi:MAG TPA: gliding motility-associated C-terminal domain-containing protein, partial [Bacteroidales bacterium]|nr:gliding motility-associated C-terminal domain-containing protein [Bacteroidales bacterium]
SNDAAISLTAATTGGTWSGTGITDADAGTFDPTAAGIGNHTITYEYTGSCGDSDDIIIVVNPVADATITPSGPFCVTDDPVVLSAVQIGGTWSGTGITNASAGLFDPEIAGIGDHIITYTITGDCGDSDQITISVIDIFDATITPVDPLCSNDDEITLIAATPGGTWSGTGITDADEGTFDPTVAGTGNHTIIYSYTGTCGSTDDIVIVVNQSADATITPIGPFCSTDDPVVLTAAQIAGTWSGTGITNSVAGLFDPEIAGTGEHIITYTISGTCGDSDQITISVIEKFDATITPVDPLCFSDVVIYLNAATLFGTWSGNGITDIGLGSFDPAFAGSGTHQIIYYQSGLCGDADTIYITVQPKADASIYPIDSLYENDDPLTIETIEPGGLWSGTGIDSEGIFDPAVSGIGEFEIIYTIEGLCGDSDSIMIYVLPNPIADLLITNAITPDADGYNDTWKIRGIEAFDYVKINIFDRWGNEIFLFDGTGLQYTDNLNQWNGKFKDRDLPSGSYLFILVLNNEIIHKGTISLIR